VDYAQGVPEMVERDNGFSERYVPPPNQAPGTQPTPTATTPRPNAALPDLTVSAITLNSHVPDGKDDCREGKNDVTVVVKNVAATNAGDFIVRLTVDDGNATEKGLDLETGAEREVGFHDVRLKKGPRSLAATAAPTIGNSESDEGNNALKVTARCEEDDD
jgi:hypothetical protein